MYRNGFATLCVLGLSACGGTTTTYAPAVYPSLAPGSQNLVSQGPFSVDRTAQVDTGNTINHAKVSVKFVSSTAVDVTVGTNAPVRLTSSGGSSFTDPTSVSPMTMIFSQSDTGSGLSSQMLTFVLKDASGANVQDAFVAGNRTVARDLPKSGSATYSGAVKVYDGSATTLADGSIALTANFGANTIGGNMTGITVGSTPANFTLNQAAMGVGSKAGTYTINGMTSSTSGVTVQTSGVTNAVEGAFFGPGGKETGGVFRIFTNAGNVVGTFGAKAP